MGRVRRLFLVCVTIALIPAMTGCSTWLLWRETDPVGKVWRVTERFEGLESMRISQEGHLCLVYRMHLTRPVLSDKTLHRLLLLAPDEVAALPQTGSPPIRRCKRHGRSFDKQEIAELTAEWQELSIDVINYRSVGPPLRAYRYATPQIPQAVEVEIPYTGGEYIQVRIRNRSGCAWWGYPVKVVLTPLTVAADIVTLPIQAYFVWQFSKGPPM